MPNRLPAAAFLDVVRMTVADEGGEAAGVHGGYGELVASRSRPTSPGLLMKRRRCFFIRGRTDGVYLSLKIG